MNHEIVIVAATRTALGSFGGTLSTIPAHKLGSAVITSLLQKTGLDAIHVDEVIRTGFDCWKWAESCSSGFNRCWST